VDLAATLSVISNPAGPYSDSELTESLFAYDYRAGSVDGDNRKLRRACDLGLPIILLRTVRAGIFVPIFPVYVVADDLPNRRFMLALDQSLRFVTDPLHLDAIERAYALRAVKQRLHQPEFRGRVLLAYEQKCAVCSLRHGELLDAAHIIGDGKPEGIPIVPNGLRSIVVRVTSSLSRSRSSPTQGCRCEPCSARTRPCGYPASRLRSCAAPACRCPRRTRTS